MTVRYEVVQSPLGGEKWGVLDRDSGWVDVIGTFLEAEAERDALQADPATPRCAR